MYMYLFFFSLSPSFWRLLIPTVTWLSMCVQPTPRNVSGQGESTMIWMMSAKMSTTTHSLKCWETGPLETTSRFVPTVKSVKLHILCSAVSILAANMKNNKEYICQCVHWKHGILRVHLIKHCLKDNGKLSQTTLSTLGYPCTNQHIGQWYKCYYWRFKWC